MALQMTMTRDEKKILAAFVWHVLKSILAGLCHIPYGRSALEEVVASKEAVPGWDPIMHEDTKVDNTSVQSAGPGQYPTSNRIHMAG
jgi:hypothetical protein